MEPLFVNLSSNPMLEKNVNYTPRLDCNDTCCTSSTNTTICFAELNFTGNLTYIEPWELGVRWSYSILVMLVAVLGNVSIMVILSKNRLLLRNSVNHFILNMAVADLITGLAGPIPFTVRDTNDLWVLGGAWCYLEGYLLMLVMLVSVTTLAIISFDRMLGVVRPFHQHLKKRQSIAIIVVIWIASALFAIPFAIYRLYTVREWEDMTERICMEVDNKMVVWWWVNVALLNWLPLTVMVISYSTIFVSFKRNTIKKNNREHPAMTHLKRRVIRMMFVVVMVFSVCWLPYQILTVSKGAFIDDSDHFHSERSKRTYNILLTVSQYMLYTNPAINPIVYALMHTTFRKAFRVTFPCFYVQKSNMVLTPGEGLQNYVWSVRSTASDVYGNDVLTQPKRNLKDRLRGNTDLKTPSALLGTSALAASIVLEHGGPTETKKKKRRFRKKNRGHSFNLDFASCTSEDDRGRHRSLSEGSGVNKHRQYTSSNKKIVKDRSWSAGGSLGGGYPVREVVITDVINPNKDDEGDLTYTSYINEGYVRDLPANGFLHTAKTRALGDLITQVIIEETSSDVEKERVL